MTRLPSRGYKLKTGGKEKAKQKLLFRRHSQVAVYYCQHSLFIFRQLSIDLFEQIHVGCDL